MLKSVRFEIGLSLLNTYESKLKREILYWISEV